MSSLEDERDKDGEQSEDDLYEKFLSRVGSFCGPGRGRILKEKNGQRHTVTSKITSKNIMTFS